MSTAPIPSSSVNSGSSGSKTISTNTIDPTSLRTPPACIADFCLVPIGTASASVSQYVAAVQRLLQQLAGASAATSEPEAESSDASAPVPTSTTSAPAAVPGPGVGAAQLREEGQQRLPGTGIRYGMHSAGTTVEGSWDEVMGVIGQCHALVHAMGVVRINTDIRVGTRTDKRQTGEDKVRVVEEILRRS